MTEVLPKIDEALASILTKLQDLVHSHGSEAVQLAIATVQASAIGDLVVGGACAFLTPIAAWGTVKAAKIGMKMSDRQIGAQMGMAAVTFCGAITTITLGCNALFRLLDQWNWIALWAPELALAHSIFVRVMP